MELTVSPCPHVRMPSIVPFARAMRKRKTAISLTLFCVVFARYLRFIVTHSLLQEIGAVDKIDGAFLMMPVLPNKNGTLKGPMIQNVTLESPVIQNVTNTPSALNTTQMIPTVEPPTAKKLTIRYNDAKCKKRHKVIDQIQVADSYDTRYPKVLCFIMTHSGNHFTKVRPIQQTWGKRCDKLLIASNVTEERFEAVAMKSDASYEGLWEKLNETMQYIWDNFRDDGYEWVYKADDDTFLIVENLKSYLISPEVQQKHTNNTPLVYGRLYSSPRYRNLAKRPVYFGSPINAVFGERFYKRIEGHKPVIYNYGGPGYAMNWKYIERFLEANKSPDTIRGIPPEDQAHGVVMAYHGIWPQNTRDARGRERFHPENPSFMYSMSEEHRKLWNDNHRATGGLSIGEECCSEQSIAFHHMDGRAIVQLERFLYSCRGRQ